MSYVTIAEFCFCNVQQVEKFHSLLIKVSLLLLFISNWLPSSFKKHNWKKLSKLWDRKSILFWRRCWNYNHNFIFTRKFSHRTRSCRKLLLLSGDSFYVLEIIRFLIYLARQVKWKREKVCVTSITLSVVIKKVKLKRFWLWSSKKDINLNISSTVSNKDTASRHF